MNFFIDRIPVRIDGELSNVNSVSFCSSRSHLLLMLFVEGINKVSKATSYGSLTLVDLAGSERIAKTGATGQTLVEAAAINKSLTALGQVNLK